MSNDLSSSGEHTRVDPTAQPPQEMSADGKRKVPHPKKKQPTTYRVLPREQRNGLIIVNTGDGKGKTTAALGLLLRATGRDMSVGMYQFFKSARVADFGEQVAARRLGVEMVQLGRGCIVNADQEQIKDGGELAKLGWARCKEIILAGTYDILVLDELTGTFKYGWIDVQDVIDTLNARPRGTHVVVTGRNTPQGLVDAADLVTEMHMIKHPLKEQGIRAQAGIDV